MEKLLKYKSDCRGMYEDEIFAQIIEDRNIKDIVHFLYPNELDMLPYTDLKNIEMAKDIFLSEFELENGTTYIMWDTDVDGCMSGAIMTKYIQTLGYNCKPVINNGKAHGLVGQDDLVNEMCEEATLLIIVDSLDSNIEQYKKLYNNDVKIIILDHHDINPNIPYDDYVCLVSSQNKYGNPHLSGAGVVFKFCKYLDEVLGKNISDDFWDLAATGIIADVCDVSESSYENRYIIDKGLDNLNHRGIKEIIGKYKFESKSVSFSIAPLINACVRVGKNDLLIDFMLSDNDFIIQEIVEEMRACRELQNKEKEKWIEQIKLEFHSQVDNNKNVLSTIIDPQYAINGVVGNELTEYFGRPVLIFSETQDGFSGSARAVGVEDFRQLYNSVTDKAQGFGHPLAFGAFFNGSLEEYNEFLNTLDTMILEDGGLSSSTDVIADCLINPEDATPNLVKKLERLNRITGQGFPRITFLVDDLKGYEVSSYSNGKHFVAKINTNFRIVEWNTSSDLKDIKDNVDMGFGITAVGELSDSWRGKTRVVELISNTWEETP